MKRKLLSFFLAAVMMLGTVIMSIPASAAELTYSDVKEDMWSYADIKYVTENGLMNGTGGSTFSPAVSLTRAMVVTVLYRLEGSPRIDFRPLFLDVKDRQYYSEAVVWAKNNNIVTATSVSEWGEEYFSPDRDITRQELATMFVRFAKYKYINTDNAAKLDKFTDNASVADWASDAMKWATDVKLINGTGNGDTLSPTGKATREQFAAIIHRFDTTDFKYNINFSEPEVISEYTEKPYPLVDNADLYVAVDGNDKNPGTKDKPLATFDAARIKVRELKKTAKDEIVVAFFAGDYGKLDNLTFTADDAGSEKAPIKYCKYGDGEVIFRNGIHIDESEFKPLDEADKTMFKKDAQPYIYKAELKGKFDKFVYNTRLFSESNTPIEAREPNFTYYTNVTTTVDPKASIMLQNFLPGIVEKFKTIEGLKMNGFLRAGYVYDCFPVLSYDKETKILTFDFENWVLDPISGFNFDEYPLMYEGRTDDLTFFSNLAEFVDMSGEYWFDNKTSTLYVYMARGDYFIADGGVYITVEKGADHLSFVGFELDGTSKDAIVADADHLTFDLLKIGNVGGLAAINILHEVTHLTISNSEFYNCVDHCVYLNSVRGRDNYTLTENKRNLTPGYNVIENNYFHDFTLPDYFSSAISVTNDVGTRIAHNYFYQGGHGAIRYNCCIDIVIEYNVFDEIMTKTQDYGAVYVWNAVTYRDNAIRYNIFKNIPVYAIYLDNNSCDQEVYGNVFYNSQFAIVQNGGRENKIYDNVLISTDSSLKTSITSGHNLNMLVDTPEQLLTHAYYVRLINAKPQVGEPGYEEWYARWPEIYDYSIDPADLGKLDCVFTMWTYLKGNAGFGVVTNDQELVKQFGIDEDNRNFGTDVNPYFVNPALGDYRLIEGADFGNLPYEKIGRY